MSHLHYPQQQYHKNRPKPNRIRVKLYSIMQSSIYRSLMDAGASEQDAERYMEAVMVDLSRDVIDFGFLGNTQ